MNRYEEIIINGKIRLTIDELSFIIDSVHCNTIETYKKDCEDYIF